MFSATLHGVALFSFWGASMAITVQGVRGTTGTGDSTTSPSWTSTTGSTIVVIGHFYNTAGTAAGTDCTDSKSNTYQLATSILGGASAPGIAIYYNIGGTRGTTHTVTVNGPGAATTTNVAVIEFTGDGTISFDSTTDATASDGTSPLEVTAAAALSGTQIGIMGVTIDTGSTNTFTNPTGYTDIYEETDGSLHLVAGAWYKNSETGTPTVGPTYGGTVTAAREAFVSFSEASSGNATVTPSTVAAVAAVPTPQEPNTAYPVISTSNSENGTSMGASQAINMPASISAGDLLMVFVSHDANATLAASGWDTLDATAAASHSTAVFAKVAAGGDTCTVTGGSTEDYAAISIRITNHGVSTPSTQITKGTLATGTSTTPDPPNCNPGVDRPYLWIEWFGSDDDDNTATYWSTNFTGINQVESAQSTSATMVSAAYWQAAGSSLNPGTMAMAASEEWHSNTYAIPGPHSTVRPSVVAAVAAVPAPTVSGAVQVAPSAVAAVASVPAPTVTVGGDALVTPAAVAAVASVPAVTVTGSAEVPASVVAAVAGVGSPAVMPVLPAAVAAVAAVPAPTVAISHTVNTTAVAAVAAVPTPTVDTVGVLYPASVSGRKLLDQNGNVFLLYSMSSWGLAQMLSDADITTALEGVQANGFNGVTVWIGGGYNLDATWHQYEDYNGNPFWTGTPWASSLGSAWARVDHVVSECQRLGLVASLSLPVAFGTTGARADMESATNTNLYNAGAAVATRYDAYDNIVWHVMIDDSYGVATTIGARIEAFFDGVNDTEGASRRPVRWMEVNNGSTTDGQGWMGSTQFNCTVNSIYDYSTDTVANFEAGYAETSGPTGDCEPKYVGNSVSALQLREQNYAVFLEGGCLVNFGHEDWWPFGATGLFSDGETWDTVQADDEVVDTAHAWSLFETYCKRADWAPTSSFVTTGEGTGDTKAAIGASAVAACAYFPDSRTIVVDTTIITGTGNVRLRWYDPTNGSYTSIAASEAQNASRSVTHPGNTSNSAGSSDWVLVVDQVDTTVTPTVVAAVAAVPAPTITATANVTPSVVAATGAVPAPTVSGAVQVATSVVAAVAAVGAPTITGSAEVPAAAVAATAAVPAPTITATANVTPAVVAAVAAVPSPTVSGSVDVAPAAVAAVAGVPAVTVTTGTAHTYLFTGTNGQSWNPNWTTSEAGGTGGTIDIQSNKGRMLTTATNFNTQRAILASSEWNGVNSEVYLEISTQLGVGQMNLFLRASGDWSGSDTPTSGYMAFLNMAGNDVTFFEVASGSATELGTGQAFTFADNTNYGVRFRLQGGDLKIRVWDLGGSEPGTWTYEQSDPTITAAGRFQMTFRTVSTAVRDLRVDNIAITSLDNATVTPSAVAAVAAVPAPTVTATATVQAAAVAAVAAVGSPTVTATATVAASAVAAVAAVAAPTITATAEVAATPVAAVASVPSPTVTASVDVAVAAVAAVASVPAPTVSTSGNTTVSPATVAATASVPAPTVVAEQSATVAVSVVAAVVAVPTPTVVTVDGGTVVAVATVAAVASVPAPQRVKARRGDRTFSMMRHLVDTSHPREGRTTGRW